MQKEMASMRLLVMILGLGLTNLCSGAGFFELQVQELHNYRGERLNGSCCGAAEAAAAGTLAAAGRTANGSCVNSCRTSFSVCLKQYQSPIVYDGNCAFGNSTTSILGGNKFAVKNPKTIRLPFSFSWIRFTLILEALDNVRGLSKPVVIERASFAGIVQPSTTWHPRTHHGHVARVVYRVRVQCDHGFYGSTCTKVCNPRDDLFGHYSCNRHGDKICMSGWMGINCEQAICMPGCHPVNGNCTQPGECICAEGWQGEYCDQCQPYPGCKHGYCNGQPLECRCEPEWGGILCDQNLDYCGTHHPCVNGGTCHPINPGTYRCTCPEGFSGEHCQVVDNPCVVDPCMNGATCMDRSGRYHCNCRPGWTGNRCQHNVNECVSSPCLHGGSCQDLVDGFKCLCSDGWEGNLCQLDSDECRGSRCENAVSCRNLVGDYQCQCMDGWTGKNCDIRLGHCSDQCQHGASCVSDHNDYHCICQPGYTGRHCETDVNDCALNPCRNGGRCIDMVDGFRCVCPAEYAGTMCQLDVDVCTPNPCQNGAACYSMANQDFYCHCPPELHGKTCNLARNTSCQGVHCNVGSCEVSVAGSDGSIQSTSTVAVCGKHGRCQSSDGDGFTCVCDRGYTGKYCHQNIDDCASDRCKNGATCVDGVNSFTCMCTTGWQGTLCDQDTNECEPNPCRNGAYCLDAEADFVCACAGDWKGKLCHLNASHCDENTCLNGGTCHELTDTFLCTCSDDWEGTTCHVPKRGGGACSRNPCLNGATCVNTGATYTCVCREGFEGERCERDIDECSPQPCYNGGSCVDGVNWFQCHCAQGFTGPDCRQHVDECASGPCTYGSTCVDHVAGYTCLCPPGRGGDTCADVLSPQKPRDTGHGATCTWRGATYTSGDTWRKSCNTCRCRNGVVSCTKLWCGAENCMTPLDPRSHLFQCGPSQVCVPSASSGCLSPPCSTTGECRKLGPGRTVGDPISPAPSGCWPNRAYLGPFCARLRLNVDRKRLNVGATVSSLCSDIRRLLVLRQADRLSDEALVVMCDLNQQDHNELLVTLSTPRSGKVTAISGLVPSMAEWLGHQLTSGHDRLAGVSDVCAETALFGSDTQRPPTDGVGSGVVTALVCSLVAVLLCAVCLLLSVARHRRRMRQLHRSEDDARQRKHENCANMRSENNLRILHNQFDRGGGGNGNRDLKGADVPKVGYKLKELAVAKPAAPEPVSVAPASARCHPANASGSSSRQHHSVYKPVNVNNLTPPGCKSINKDPVPLKTVDSAVSHPLRPERTSRAVLELPSDLLEVLV